jgi:hypothetical protein
MILSLHPWGYSPLGRSKQTNDPGTLPSFAAAATGSSEVAERGLIYGYGWLGRSPSALTEWLPTAGSSGGADAPLSAITGAATGTETHDATGTGDVDISPLTAVASGTETHDTTGTVDADLDALTASATGVIPIAGTTAATLLALTGSADGKITFSGSASATLQAATAAASAKLRFVGAPDAALPSLSADADGFAPPTGTVSATLAAPTASATGVHGTGTEDQQPEQVVTYTCVLTGSADGLSDLTLPISTFQARHKDDASSYGAITVPAGAQYADAIAARPNGEIVVTWHQGTLDEEALRFPPDDIRLDRGASSSTLSISGNYDAAARDPKLFTLTDVSYIATSSGSTRYRAAGRGDLRPGDFTYYGGTYSEVSEVVWSVSVGATTMELVV